ncbi:MAG: enoyl-CoA hydratase/isomerase family protein [Sinobacteraceae bacterium]|nr:enoyl-CoA hydratase/isomerase family protein [Nevskiaceae bacterium]
MSEEPHLLTEEAGPILIATLNRPEKLNALSGQLMQLFEASVHYFRDTPGLKVMLIRAKGRYFSAGADMLSGDPEGGNQARTATAIRELHRLKLHGMQRIYDEMEAIEKPFVVAHHALCVGGGLELSLSCDFRLAAKNAGYSFPEGKFGSLPASNGVSRLTRIVGTHWARYLIMANKPVDAERALLMGLVHEVWPNDIFEEEVMRFCRHVAEQNGEQMGAAKIAIELARDVGLAQARNVERMANSALMLNPQYLAGIEKYIAGIGGRGKKE